jgi:hypothetical protein
VKDRIVISLWVAAFCGVFFEMMYLMGNMQSAPTTADPSTAHIVPFMSHGVIFYVTPVENVLFCYVIPPIVLFLLLTGLYFAFADRIKTEFGEGKRPIGR